ncbi:hypothetical protein AHMF7605_02720 [Adhaeribacter arboris]|uniref:Uncharacterized protein n=1 Tax=Adhaeribacter arboris TaxID=2072846 RepID=A0A2T2YAH6_9BACT|nr:hypothetical protein [Adhaeribacter arboris]PSR52512.1 hypothetical protein AHMF7605_02720 [Adhaeribacter arboris]
MERTIFYFKELRTWDIVTILLYSFISLGLYFFYTSTESVVQKKDILFWYPLGTQVFFYFLNYKSLRNLTVYFIWFFFSLIHFYIYLQLITIPLLEGVKVHAAIGLRNTALLLILFQILRFISTKVQGKELVCPSRGGTDILEERNVTLVDFALFVIYLFFLVVLGLNFHFN